MMLSTRAARAGRVAGSLSRRLWQVQESSCPTGAAAVAVEGQPFSRQQQQWYSNTPVWCKKEKKLTPQEIEDERVIEEVYQDLPDIQTHNAPEGMTEEDMYKMLEELQEEARKKEEEKWVKDWKPGMRKRPLMKSFKEEDFIWEYDPTMPKRWTQRDRRCGMLAIKVGMMPWFDDWGERHPCTLLYCDQNIVMGHKTMDKHGYMAVQVAAGQRKAKNVRASVLGQYKELLEKVDYEDNHPPYIVREFRVSDEEWLVPLHTQIHARHFVPGQNVDVAGISKGKGFQGPMKRWGFAGMPASHGVSKSHRAHGSTGACQDPGRVWKGKKMAGRMGSDRVTVQNLRLLKVDRGRNLVYVRGAVPGQNGNWVEIRDAIKRPLWETDKVSPDVETGEIMLRPPLPTFAFDETIDGCGEAGHEDIMPLNKKDPLNYFPEEGAA